MIDIWLKTSQKLVNEIIEESKLKEIVKKKLEVFMETDEFEKFVNATLENKVKEHIEEYAEFYLIDPQAGWIETEEKIRQLIVKNAIERGK